MTEEFAWYKLAEADDDLLQGDLIRECPIIVPQGQFIETDELDVVTRHYNAVIMSQSCDLEQGKIDLVLVCPFWDLTEFVEGGKDDFLRSRKGKEALRRGYLPGYHLLNRCSIEGFETDYLVVDFRNVYGVPFDSLSGLTRARGPRIRLLPPYREHLSQAFARYFMRVGLPVDIPPF
ncbi:MAG: hypothetical protein QOH93_3122 [Chloroflexia bacterium]|jgi:hypothetical protein|nr:hypothetical protein [Chloroflexia bacterium]